MTRIIWKDIREKVSCIPGDISRPSAPIGPSPCGSAWDLDLLLTLLQLILP